MIRQVSAELYLLPGPLPLTPNSCFGAGVPQDLILLGKKVPYTLLGVKKGSSIILNAAGEIDPRRSLAALLHKPGVCARRPFPR